ncbi:UFD1-domain-containing protein [Martensiomyces pterosporus]|nr:UFD1-domain-containing protein [Martensiomyces pterosporus]
MYADDDDFGYGTYGGFGGGFGGFQPARGFPLRQRQFSRFYSAYSVTQHPDNKFSANFGGKIFLPASALDELIRLEIMYPMLFSLRGTSPASSGAGEGKITHCGVLEFTAEEGRVYLPDWMMDLLSLTPGAHVEVTNVSMPLGKFVKLQAQSPDFLDITDPRAVLENALRNFSALTVGDIIAIEYNDKIYKMGVLEIKPEASAINIVETDLSVDFAPPLGYVEPSRPGTAAGGSNSSLQDISRPASSIAKDVKKKEMDVKDRMDGDRFVPFRGSGLRLSSKTQGESSASVRSYAATPVEEKDKGAVVDTRGGEGQVPVPLDLPIGTLFFGYESAPPPGAELEDVKPDDIDGKFAGEGRALRQRRKRK